MNDKPLHLVVISAGVSDPSTTRMLAERTTAAAMEHLRAGGAQVTASFVDLAAMGADIGRSIVSADPTAPVQRAIELVGSADGLIAATPVYKAGISGLFKSFADLLDNDLIVAKPAILSATAGTARHAMVVDEQLRPLFAFMRALPVPTSLFAAPEDWADPALGKRIDRAAVEFTELVRAGVGRAITDAAWKGYQHQFNGNATRAEKSADDLDFDTRLMRLAAGGRSLVETRP
ncbi:CE1759 family FMN reductase [Promicromonospora sp. NPDC019610]|uniref:CE1759 family FMN reductase n=1 Tax=Promicromonospora sp. NPDC019610 TaxID=3364405 RepID=UPI0037B0920F